MPKSTLLVTTTHTIEGRRVTGVALAYETVQVQDGGSMLMVSASGTAVVLQ